MINKRSNNAPNFILISMLIPILLIIFLSVPLLLSKINFSFPRLYLLSFINIKTLQGFSAIFLSIILEAFPFIMIGTLISSIIQVFVSEETLAKIIPQNKLLGLLCASLIGLIFPVCDCAIVPIVRRLLKKGLPLYIGITFMLSVPIINPIVLCSTYYAFSSNIYMVIIRGGLGIMSAIIVGYLISFTEVNKNILKDDNNSSIISHLHHNHDHENHSHCHCGCEHEHHHENQNIFSIFSEILEHTTIELHDVGKYVILGSFLSAFMQTFIDRKYILSVGQNKVLSVIVMICFAFLLAVCSETDAFIAKTFVGQFTAGSIIAFLIFGPMIDIKNTLMLSSTFKKRFIIKLIFVIFSICFILGTLINILSLRGLLPWLS